jgi:peptide/nickel transport system substrate-binding protein
MSFQRLIILLMTINGLLNCQAMKKKHKDPFTLTLHMGTDPITLNPILAEDAYSATVSGRIYDSLIERDNVTLQWKGMLASNWDVSNDHLKYTFYLRKNIKFHDGVGLTARDVIFTYQKIMEPSTPNPSMKVYFQNILRVHLDNAYKVTFFLKEPYYQTLSHIGGFPILPEHIFANVKDFVNNEYNFRKPVGTGAYRFSSWVTRQKVVLERNEDYWREKPSIKKIEYKIIEDSSVALQALKKKELDMLNLTPFQWTKQTESEKFKNNFEKYKYISMGYRYIGYNTRRFPFQDKRVRIAMVHLIDREKILQKILQNLAVITTGNFWVDSPQYNHALKPREYEPRKALELLKEAGFLDNDKDGLLDDGKRKLSFELLIPSGAEFYQRFAAIVKEDMASVGVDMQIRQVQFQALVEKMNERDFDALMLGWSMGIESDPYQLWHSSQLQKGHNFTGFSTPEMDSIIEKARLEFNNEKRNKMYHRFHEILYENQPYTFLFTGFNLLALENRFESVNVYKTGVDITEWTIRPSVGWTNSPSME